MVFGWLIPCIFVMAVAACLAELTSAMPYVSPLKINRFVLTSDDEGRAEDCTTSRRDLPHHVGHHLLVGSQAGRTSPVKSL